jgi:cysteine desulfurase
MARMPGPPIYLDHNATAPMLPEVADAVREASLRYHGNPASQHEPGRQARRALETARASVGELLGACTTGVAADRVIFTSGGTESNNLALTGLTQRAVASPPPAPRIVISAIEHPSVARTAEYLAAHGWQVDCLAVDRRGVVRLEQLAELLTADARLASVMLANNETGVLQPIAAIAAACRQRGVPIHTDASQAVGKTPVNFRELGVDALTATAHKFHGPLGIGVLLVRHGVRLEPALRGGFQQAEARPGTESTALAIGMATALERWHAEAEARRARMTSFRDQFEQAILTGFPSAVVIGADATRLPHTSNIAFSGLDRQVLVMALDLAGVAASTGSACASGSSEPSPTLTAMGLPEEQISGSVRFSLGATTTAAEIDDAARRILNVCNHLRQG